MDQRQVKEVVRECDDAPGKWCVYSHDGSKKLGGPYDTKPEATKRLGQIEFFKKQKGAMEALAAREGMTLEEVLSTSDYEMLTDTTADKKLVPNQPAVTTDEGDYPEAGEKPEPEKEPGPRTCVCPECSTKLEKEEGSQTSCQELKCPKCSAQMQAEKEEAETEAFSVWERQNMPMHGVVSVGNYEPSGGGFTVMVDGSPANIGVDSPSSLFVAFSGRYSNQFALGLAAALGGSVSRRGNQAIISVPGLATSPVVTDGVIGYMRGQGGWAGPLFGAVADPHLLDELARSLQMREVNRLVGPAQFITEFSEEQLPDEPGLLHKYAVWGDIGRDKPEVAETSDDVDYLQNKYGPGLRVVRVGAGSQLQSGRAVEQVRVRTPDGVGILDSLGPSISTVYFPAKREFKQYPNSAIGVIGAELREAGTLFTYEHEGYKVEISGPGEPGGFLESWEWRVIDPPVGISVGLQRGYTPTEDLARQYANAAIDNFEHLMSARRPLHGSRSRFIAEFTKRAKLGGVVTDVLTGYPEWNRMVGDMLKLEAEKTGGLSTWSYDRLEDMRHKKAALDKRHSDLLVSIAADLYDRGQQDVFYTSAQRPVTEHVHRCHSCGRTIRSQDGRAGGKNRPPLGWAWYVERGTFHHKYCDLCIATGGKTRGVPFEPYKYYTQPYGRYRESMGDGHSLRAQAGDETLRNIIDWMKANAQGYPRAGKLVDQAIAVSGAGDYIDSSDRLWLEERAEAILLDLGLTPHGGTESPRREADLGPTPHSIGGWMKDQWGVLSLDQFASHHWGIGGGAERQAFARWVNQKNLAHAYLSLKSWEELLGDWEQERDAGFAAVRSRREATVLREVKYGTILLGKVFGEDAALRVPVRTSTEDPPQASILMWGNSQMEIGASNLSTRMYNLLPIPMSNARGMAWEPFVQAALATGLLASARQMHERTSPWFATVDGWEREYQGYRLKVYPKGTFVSGEKQWGSDIIRPTDGRTLVIAPYRIEMQSKSGPEPVKQWATDHVDRFMSPLDWAEITTAAQPSQAVRPSREAEIPDVNYKDKILFLDKWGAGQWLPGTVIQIIHGMDQMHFRSDVGDQPDHFVKVSEYGMTWKLLGRQPTLLADRREAAPVFGQRGYIALEIEDNPDTRYAAPLRLRYRRWKTGSSPDQPDHDEYTHWNARGAAEVHAYQIKMMMEPNGWNVDVMWQGVVTAGQRPASLADRRPFRATWHVHEKRGGYGGSEFVVWYENAGYPFGRREFLPGDEESAFAYIETLKGKGHVMASRDSTPVDHQELLDQRAFWRFGESQQPVKAAQFPHLDFARNVLFVARSFYGKPWSNSVENIQAIAQYLKVGTLPPGLDTVLIDHIRKNASHYGIAGGYEARRPVGDRQAREAHQMSFNPVDFTFRWTDDWYEWDYSTAHQQAQQARNAKARELRAQGYKVRSWTMRNQRISRGGIGSGKPHIDLVVTVYMIDYREAKRASRQPARESLGLAQALQVAVGDVLYTDIHGNDVLGTGRESTPQEALARVEELRAGQIWVQIGFEWSVYDHNGQFMELVPASHFTSNRRRPAREQVSHKTHDVILILLDLMKRRGGYQTGSVNTDSGLMDITTMDDYYSVFDTEDQLNQWIRGDGRFAGWKAKLMSHGGQIGTYRIFQEASRRPAREQGSQSMFLADFLARSDLISTDAAKSFTDWLWWAKRDSGNTQRDLSEWEALSREYAEYKRGEPNVASRRTRETSQQPRFLAAQNVQRGQEVFVQLPGQWGHHKACVSGHLLPAKGMRGRWPEYVIVEMASGGVKAVKPELVFVRETTHPAREGGSVMSTLAEFIEQHDLSSTTASSFFEWLKYHKDLIIRPDFLRSDDEWRSLFSEFSGTMNASARLVPARAAVVQGLDEWGGVRVGQTVSYHDGLRSHRAIVTGIAFTRPAHSSDMTPIYHIQYGGGKTARVYKDQIMRGVDRASLPANERPDVGPDAPEGSQCPECGSGRIVELKYDSMGRWGCQNCAAAGPPEMFLRMSGKSYGESRHNLLKAAYTVELKVGDPVLIIGGSSKGERGVVTGDYVDTYMVEFPDGSRRRMSYRQLRLDESARRRAREQLSKGYYDASEYQPNAPFMTVDEANSRMALATGYLPEFKEWLRSSSWKIDPNTYVDLAKGWILLVNEFYVEQNIRSARRPSRTCGMGGSPVSLTAVVLAFAQTAPDEWKAEHNGRTYYIYQAMSPEGTWGIEVFEGGSMVGETSGLTSLVEAKGWAESKAAGVVAGQRTRYRVTTTFTHKDGTLGGVLRKTCPGLRKAKLQQQLNREWLILKGHAIDTEEITPVTSNDVVAGRRAMKEVVLKWQREDENLITGHSLRGHVADVFNNGDGTWSAEINFLDGGWSANPTKTFGSPMDAQQFVVQELSDEARERFGSVRASQKKEIKSAWHMGGEGSEVYSDRGSIKVGPWVERDFRGRSFAVRSSTGMASDVAGQACMVYDGVVLEDESLQSGEWEIWIDGDVRGGTILKAAPWSY